MPIFPYEEDYDDFLDLDPVGEEGGDYKPDDDDDDGLEDPLGGA